MKLCLTIISKDLNSFLCCSDVDVTVTVDLDHHTITHLKNYDMMY